MQEEKAACSFEQTPGGGSPKGKELGSRVWPWISRLPTDQKNHGDNRALPREGQPTEALGCQPADLDVFGTSSAAILLLLNTDKLVCFIKENSREKKSKSPSHMANLHGQL